MAPRKDGFIFFAADELIRRYRKHNLSASGAQLAYFFLLSLFPFLIFLIAFMGFFSVSLKGIIPLLSAIAPKAVLKIIEDFIDLLPKRNTNLLSGSILLSMWSGSKGIDSLINALNRAYGIENSRGFIKKRILSMAYTLLVAFSIVLALTIPNIGMDLILRISKYIGLTDFFITLWYYLKWVFIILILFLVIGSLYYVAPNKKLIFYEVVPGTIFAIFGWIVISLGFSYFVNNFRNYAIIYGSLAAVIVLMVWLYLSGLILVIGGEINSVFLLYRERMVKEKSY